MKFRKLFKLHESNQTKILSKVVFFCFRRFRGLLTLFRVVAVESLSLFCRSFLIENLFPFLFPIISDLRPWTSLFNRSISLSFVSSGNSDISISFNFLFKVSFIFFFNLWSNRPSKKTCVHYTILTWPKHYVSRYWFCFCFSKHSFSHSNVKDRYIFNNTSLFICSWKTRFHLHLGICRVITGSQWESLKLTNVSNQRGGSFERVYILKQVSEREITFWPVFSKFLSYWSENFLRVKLV